MIKFSTHAKNQWTIRGDVNRRITEAWQDGIKVECPDQECTKARLDLDSNTILLCGDDTIKTVITVYKGTRFHVREPTECYDCGQHYHNQGDCPSCGSHKWRCR